MSRKIDGVRTNPAPHFEDFFFAPAREFSASWDVGFHKVLPRLDLVEILLSADGLSRMPNIARTPVPVILHLIDLNFRKSHKAFPAALIR